MPRGPRLAALELTYEEKTRLDAWAHGRTTPRALALRARIVLGCARSLSNSEVARRLALAPHTVGRWRKRFITDRLEGLRDAPRPGAPRKLGEAQVQRLISAALGRRPRGERRWTTRGLARELGIAQTTASRACRALGLKLHRSARTGLARNSAFSARVRAIAGLYLNPPLALLALEVDESLEPTPPRSARASRVASDGRARRTSREPDRDSSRLLALLKVATADPAGRAQVRIRAKPLLRFLRLLDSALPQGPAMHLILDQDSALRTPAVESWLARHPRFRVHVMPTPSAWLEEARRWLDLPLAARNELERAMRARVDRRASESGLFAWTRRPARQSAGVARRSKRGA